MNTFLSNTQIKKLDLLQYLSLSDQVTTKQLATDWAVSTKSINRYCDSLQEDLDYYIPDLQVHLENKQGTILLSLPGDISYHYLKDSLTMAYTQESIKINIIDTLLTDNFKSVADLAEALHLTPTTVYSHLYQLENILDPFEMTFKWTKQTQGFNFVYEEKKIRYFSYLFYWKFFKGNSPIIQQKTLDYHTQFDLIKAFTKSDTSDLTLHQICYIAQITRWHLQKSDSVVLEPTSVETLKIMASVLDYSEVFPDSRYPLNEAERLFFNFQVRIATSLDTNEIRETIIQRLETANTYLFDYCHTLYQQLCTQFNLSPTKTKRFHFIYNMICFTLYNNELGIPVDNPFMDDFNLMFHTPNELLDNQALPMVREIFKRVSKEYNQTVSNENLAQLMVILFLTNRKKETSLTILLNFSSNPMGNATIKTQLLQVFNPEKITFSDDISKADLVISDNALLHGGHLPFFFMDSLNDSAYWSSLFETVQKKLVEVIFQAN